jgi:hypothetical protein
MMREFVLCCIIKRTYDNSNTYRIYPSIISFEKYGINNKTNMENNRWLSPDERKE